MNLVHFAIDRRLAWLCLSGLLLAGIAAGQRNDFVLESSGLAAHFSSEGVLSEIRAKAGGERFSMESAEQFRISTGTETITSENCRLAAISRGKDGLEILYRDGTFEIRVQYRLGVGDHFLEKRMTIRHLGPKPFTLDHLSMGSWHQSGQAGQLVPFRHGQCVTYFLRRPPTGFFFGVRTPFEDVLPADSARLDLSYPIRIIFPAGTAYEAEPAYWGVDHLTGRYAPKVPSKIKESMLSETPPDLGESEAMLRMVRQLAPPRGGMTLVYNGYQGGLYLGDYGDPDGREQAERDIESLRIAKQMLGPAIVQPSAPFFGAFREALKLTPQDDHLTEPPARRKLLDWIRANGMQAMDWASLKAVHGWNRPRLGPYCPDHPEWQAEPRINCPANPEFVDWLTTIIMHDIRGGFAGFVSDEPPPGLRYRLWCEKPGHQHLPGDVSYAYFYRRREMFRKLRAAFGTAFELQGQRPHMDAGIWDATYLNSIFTFLEDPGVTADTIRLWSRMRRDYSFVPSYMDQIVVQPGFEPVDFTMLSAIAVSSNYLFLAPSSKEKLKDHALAVTKDNRVMAQGLRNFPEADRKRVRHWLDWARQHREYMDDVIDLPGWPGQGKPDGYLRLKSGRGFAFLFNSSASPQRIAVPLNRQVGLNPRTDYRLSPVYAPGAKPMVCRAEADVLLPERSAWLLRIEPNATLPTNSRRPARRSAAGTASTPTRVPPR